MTNQEFYNLLDQAGHRLGNLAKNSPGYAFELRKLIEIVSEKNYSQVDLELLQEAGILLSNEEANKIMLEIQTKAKENNAN